MKRALVAAVLFVSCRMPVASDDPELVTNLRFSPSAFDSFRSNTELRYTLKYPVRVSAAIVHRDSTGMESLVSVLSDETLETAGSHAHPWLGETVRGVFAPAGRYIGRLRTEGRTFDARVIVYH